MVRPVTQQTFDCLMLDMWPGNAAVCDFGLDSPEHFGALQFAVKRGGVTVEQLDAALGDGPALTKLVQIEGNPYGNVTFHTAWDVLEEAEEEMHDVMNIGNPLAVLNS